MKNLKEKLTDHIEENTQLNEIYNEYERISAVYNETLIAMGITVQGHSVIKNSSEVSFKSSNDSSSIIRNYE